MKQLLCYLSLLCALIFTYTVHAQTITVTVTAPPYSPGAGSGSGMDGYTPTGSAVANMGNNASFIADKIAEAKAQCLNDSITKFAACSTSVSNNTMHNTSVCNNMGAGAAGITASVTLWATAVGSSGTPIVGAALGAAVFTITGAIGSFAYSQCTSMVTKISTNGGIKCTADKELAQVKCNAIQ